MNIRYKNRFDKQRRDILKTLTHAGISSGLLRSCSLVGGMMIGRTLEAQGASPSKSLLLLMTGGTIQSLWKPQSANNMNVMTQPFADENVNNDVNFVSGLRNNGGHGSMFQHFAHGFNSDSFDANMGNTIGENFPLRYLNLGVESAANNMTRDNKTGGFVPSIDSPASALSRLSANNNGGSSGGSGADPRQTYVDTHKQAIDALRVKLGQHEKEKLDSHLNAIEDLERKLTPTTGPTPPQQTCSSVQDPPASSGRNSFETTAFKQIEVALLALECNITASVSLAFGNDGHGYTVPTYNNVLHNSHHCCPGTALYENTGKYTNMLIARTIRRAKEKGLLNDTLVTQVTDMGDGRGHTQDNVAITVAGAGVRKGVVTSASGHQYDLFQTVSQILGADQHPDAKKYGNAIGGIAS